MFLLHSLQDWSFSQLIIINIIRRAIKSWVSGMIIFELQLDLLFWNIMLVTLIIHISFFLSFWGWQLDICNNHFIFVFDYLILNYVYLVEINILLMAWNIIDVLLSFLITYYLLSLYHWELAFHFMKSWEEHSIKFLMCLWNQKDCL